MTKMTLALAAAVLAGTTMMTSAANAGGVRLGFGFPLGSFVAHSNENYGGGDYRRAERPRYVRRDYQDDAPPVRKVAKVKRPVQTEIAEASVKTPTTPAVKTVKAEDSLASDSATTTVIAKTPVASTETKATVTAEKIASAEKPATVKADAETTTAVKETKHVCRRYSPAIAELVDVPCE